MVLLIDSTFLLLLLCIWLISHLSVLISSFHLEWFVLLLFSYFLVWMIYSFSSNIYFLLNAFKTAIYHRFWHRVLMTKWSLILLSISFCTFFHFQTSRIWKLYPPCNSCVLRFYLGNLFFFYSPVNNWLLKRFWRNLKWI